MKEGDFVQFYVVRLSPQIDCRIYDISNGFSYINEHVKSRWIDVKKHAFFKPQHENVYVSTWFPKHQHIVLKWARKFPQNNFILGGPLYQAKEIRCNEDIPSNVRFQTGLIEDCLNIPVDPKSWKIIFPHNEYKFFQYSYYIGIKCYWHKCNFCFSSRLPNDLAKRIYSLEPLWTAPKGIAFLSTPAATAAMLRDILPNLNYSDKAYFIYIRSGKKELETLKKISDKINFKRIIFGVGVEFPSDRMLKIMNKGTSLQEYINMLRFLRESGARVNCSYITNWPEITKEDLKDVKHFFDSINSQKQSDGRTNHIWGKLFITQDATPQEVNSDVKMRFTTGYNPVLSGEKEKWNNEYIKILQDNNGISKQEKSKKMVVTEEENDLYKKFILPLDEKLIQPLDN